ncbi:EF hand domain/PKD domain protein [Desulfocucumis palustris]|uniref:EF hand domain/PKD domain protein n=1 Tax=Desulfocucumis palustris TaxID=1898651 RepID=A0A2L2XF38_9FIRM|nr:putative Ig domain-containing protein [Desulfocucumis palustris]GBF34845.1 EF hand domain/PKD domain protein [Desulfocucumis palustris]
MKYKRHNNTCPGCETACASVKEAADMRGLTGRMFNCYCANGGIKGAVKIKCPGDSEGCSAAPGQVGAGEYGNPAISGTGSGSLTIPETVTQDAITYTVTSIGDYAFFCNSALDGKLILGNSVQAIGISAFSDCANLDNAWFLGDRPTSFGNSVFDNCKSGFTLYYPQDNLTWDGYTYDGADTINIEASIAPAIITVNLPNGTLGLEYEYSLTATGNEPIVWMLSGGSLPDGIDLESDGDLSGTPSVPGTFNFSVTATNASGNDTQALSVSHSVYTPSSHWSAW